MPTPIRPRRGPAAPSGPALAHRPVRTLLSVEAAAEQLGISRTTLYALLRTGALRSVRIGRRRLLPPAALDAYVAGLIHSRPGA